MIPEVFVSFKSQGAIEARIIAFRPVHLSNVLLKFEKEFVAKGTIATFRLFNTHIGRASLFALY